MSVWRLNSSGLGYSSSGIKLEINLTKFELLFELLFRNEKPRTDVLIEFFRYFDECYQEWQQEEKREEISKIIKTIIDDLSETKYKKDFNDFVIELYNNLKSNKQRLFFDDINGVPCEMISENYIEIETAKKVLTLLGIEFQSSEN